MRNYQKDLEDILDKSLLYSLEQTPQNPKWHPEGNVLNHTLLVMKGVDNSDEASFEGDELYVAAMFHDLGKIDTTCINEKGYIVAYGHEAFAKNYINFYREKILKKYPNIDLDLVKHICAQHMRTHLYLNGKMSNPNKRDAFERDPYFMKLLVFAKCDDSGKEV